MPEEINRMVCDQLSSILFAPTQTAVDNLKKEGFDTLKPVFKDGSTRRVCLSGDVMYDNAIHFVSIAEKKCNILQQYNLQPKQFVLSTIHRPANTDDPKRLNSIFRALLTLSRQDNTVIVLPLHPRTANILEQSLDAGLYNEVKTSSAFRLIPPVSFLEILMLEKYAKVVVTDSGGVQKESFFFETPSVILRTETEWVEIVNNGAGILADADESAIVNAYRTLANQNVYFPPLFGDGHAAERILNFILG